MLRLDTLQPRMRLPYNKFPLVAEPLGSDTLQPRMRLPYNKFHLVAEAKQIPILECCLTSNILNKISALADFLSL